MREVADARSGLAKVALEIERQPVHAVERSEPRALRGRSFLPSVEPVA